MSDTNIKEFELALKEVVGSDRVRVNELLRNHTTWRVGGPADLFFIATSEDDIIHSVLLAKKYAVPYVILGGGANVLAGDLGFRGIVIKNQYEAFSFVDVPPDWEEHSTDTARHVAVHFHYYDDSKNPNYNADTVFVRISSGYSMPHFIRDSLNSGLTGLEWFMRIPGTFGGWVYNNVHGHTIFIGDFVYTLRILTESGDVVEKPWSSFDFAYDYSNLHTNNDIVLSGIIRLFKGNVDLSREVAKEVLLKKNQHQAANSAGCVFHNISKEDQERNRFESNAVGYIIDKVLHLNGQYKVGGAWISEKHGNFIETDGTATASDVLAVMDFMKKKCKDMFSIELKDEIFRIGEF